MSGPRSEEPGENDAALENDDAPVKSDEGVPEASQNEPARRGRGVGAWTFRALLWIVGATALLLILLIRTAAGNRVVLEFGLDRVREGIAGSIEVGEIRSGDLLRRARLLDVRLLTAEGDTFVVADSIEAGYDVAALVAGRIGLSGVRVWGGDIRIEQGARADTSTLGRWLGPPAPDTLPPDASTPQRVSQPIRISDVELRDVAFRLRLPTDLAPGGLVRVDTAGSERLALDVLVEAARLPVVRLGGGGPTEIEVARGEATVDVLRESIFIDALEAGVRIGDGVVAVQIEDVVLPYARGTGTVAVGLGRDQTELDVALALDEVVADSLRWISAEIPPVRGASRLTGQIRGSESRWSLAEAGLTWEGGDVRGGGTVALSPSGLRLQDVDARVAGLPVAALDRWLPEPARVGGRVGGRLRLDGALSRLEVGSELTWTTPLAQPVVARVSGGLTGLGSSSLGFDALSLTLAPFDWAALRRSGGIPVPLDGPGFLTADLSGALDTGIVIAAEARHLARADGIEPSLVRVDGSVRSVDEGVLGLDLATSLEPFDLGILRIPTDSGPPRTLPLDNPIEGSVRLTGDTRDLRLDGEIDDGTGRASFAALLTPSDSTFGFRVDATLEGIGGVTLRPLGERTTLNGDLAVEGVAGSGRSPITTIRASLGSSEVSGVDVDSARVSARLEGGRLEVDTLRGGVGGFEVDVAGALGMEADAPVGELRGTFATSSLAGLRSTFLGDSLLARPEDGLRRRALEAEGIDPDTLPSQAEVQWAGAVRGDVVLSGTLEDLAVEASAVAEGVRIGTNTIGRVQLEAAGDGLPAEGARVDVRSTVDSLAVFDRSFTRAEIRGAFGARAGDVRVDLTRGEEEGYEAAGAYRLDEARREIRVDSMRARFDRDGTLAYRLERPTRIGWGDGGFDVEDLEVRRLGPDPVVIRADGRIPERGAAEFDLSIEGLYLGRLTQVLQRPDLDLAGRIDFEGSLRGRAADPVIDGELSADSLRWRRLEFGAVRGAVDYTSRSAEVELRASRGEDVVLDISGVVPVDLALTPGTRRLLDREMNIDIRATDLPARATVAPLRDLEDVQGVVSGRLRVAGTLERPRTSGSITLADGAWTIGSLGVRHTSVEGRAELAENNVLTVDVSGRAGGTVDVDGTITLSSLTDPEFDLGFEFDEFLGVDRRDMNGVFSGSVRLTESYRSPFVKGALTVDEGTLYIDEFLRNAAVVDLSNPRFVTALDDRDGGTRLLDIGSNPFMNGLRTEIQIGVGNNSWLRGENLNVSMVGSILMVFDRSTRDFALDGDLEARRGQYTRFGRTFQVEGGSVQFIGTPGINPLLDIDATTRVRRQEFGDLEVTANVGGTLTEPTVTFSAGEQGVSESDIFSYLTFGQPSTGITSGSAAQREAALAGSAVSFATGTIFSQIGNLAAQQSDLIDYISITGVGELPQGTGGALSSTQVEVGRYFAGGDLFGALILRASALRSQPVGGARVEWQSSERFHVEAFFEDRFLRVASLGLADVGSGAAYVFGFALVREWGY